MMAMSLSPSSSSASSSSVPLHFDQTAARSAGDCLISSCTGMPAAAPASPARENCDTVSISGSAASAPSGSRQVDLRCASHCSAAFWDALCLFMPEDHHKADDAAVQLFLVGSNPPQCHLHNFQPCGHRSDAKSSAAHRGGAHGVAPGSTQLCSNLERWPFPEDDSCWQLFPLSIRKPNQKPLIEKHSRGAAYGSDHCNTLCCVLWFFFKWPWFSAYCPQHSKIITYLGKMTTLSNK